MTKTKKVSKLELEILELESKLAPVDYVSHGGKGGGGSRGGDLNGAVNAKGEECYDEICIPRPEGAEC